MSRKKVGDSQRLFGNFGEKQALMKHYGFEVSVKVDSSNAEIEDIALRCYNHNMILEGGVEAMVVRRKRDIFIHQVLKPGLGLAGDRLSVIFEIIEYNKAMNRIIAYIRTPYRYLDQRIPCMHGLDVAWGKCESNNGVNFFWNHRGGNQQYVINKDNTIGCMSRPDIVLGCNDSGELILVSRDDKRRRMVFEDLHVTLTKQVEHRLSKFRVTGLTVLKKQGYIKDWKEPGTSERKMPGRLACFEIMARLIHEVITFEGVTLRPGDPYFASRIERCSQHEVELMSRNEVLLNDGKHYIDLTFQCDIVEECTIRIDVASKHIQYIASQYYEAMLDVVWPANLMFDVSTDKPRNSFFIHNVLFIDFINEADVAKDDPTLPVYFEEVVLDNKDLSYVQVFNKKHNTKFIERAYFIKWVGKVEHAFDVQDGKIEENRQVLFFWQHRGRNQQFCVDEKRQTIHPLGKFELALGCRDDVLKLVPSDCNDMLRFNDLSSYLKKEKRLDANRLKEISTMSRENTEWSSPVVLSYAILGAIMDAAFT